MGAKVNQNSVNMNTFHVKTKKSDAKTRAEISLFNKLDTDKDGKLSSSEIQGIVKGKVKGNNGKLVEIEVIKIKDMQNGRALVITSAGNKYVRNPDGVLITVESAEQQIANENSNTRKKAEQLADQFYKIADDNAGINSMNKMQNLLDKNINKKNIVAFLDAYDRTKTKQGDSSIIDTVTSETGAGASTPQRNVLMTIMNTLCEAAKDAGVSEKDIAKAKKDFTTSLDKEFKAWYRRTNPKDMEKALDFLRGAIAAKQTKDVHNVTEEEAIGSFNKTNQETVSTAQKTYNDAKGEDWSWTAKVGDTVCGWFGCNTIKDMETKLGKHAKSAKELNDAAVAIGKAKTPEQKQKAITNFKNLYKTIFKIDFDKNKIEAYNAAKGNYQQAQNLNAVKTCSQNLINKSKSMNYNQLKSEIKQQFQFDDATIDNIIQNYGVVKNVDTSNEAKKREMLMEFLTENYKNATSELNKLTNGKTLEQMGKDVDLVRKSAFGTEDIVKDVIQFNENMETTQMVTEAAFEIAGTIALQFVPGMGQAAAARLATSAARWGTRAVKVANAAAKAEKIFATAVKVQQGTMKTNKAVNLGSRIVSSAVSAGVATAAVDLSNGDQVKDVMKKTLMNMSFAGAGAGANIIAPKLVQAFGIESKLATEIAEEIINTASSYGITKMSGADYSKQDALIDFATGLIMSRVSGAMSGKASKSGKADAQTSHNTHDASSSSSTAHNTPDADAATNSTRASSEAEGTSSSNRASSGNESSTRTSALAVREGASYDETVSKLRSSGSRSARTGVDADGNKIVLVHRNLVNAGDYTYYKFDPNGKMIESGQIKPSDVPTKFGEDTEFSRLNSSRSGQLKASVLFGLEDLFTPLVRTLEINIDHLKIRPGASIVDKFAALYHVDVNDEAAMKAFEDKLREIDFSGCTTEAEKLARVKETLGDVPKTSASAKTSGAKGSEYVLPEKFKNDLDYAIDELRLGDSKQAIEQVYAEICTRIQNGEIPSKSMLENITQNLSGEVGIPASFLRQRVLKTMDHCGSGWAQMKHYFQTSAEVSPTNSTFVKHFEQLKNDMDIVPVKTNEVTAPKGEDTAATPKKSIEEMQQDSLLSSSLKRMIRQSDYPEAIQEVFDTLAQKIKNGETPNNKMWHDLVNTTTEKYNIRPGKLGLELDYIMAADNGWKNIRDIVTEVTRDADAIKGKMATFKEQTGIYSDAEIAAQKAAQQAELEAAAAKERHQQEVLAKYSDKYPAVAEAQFKHGDDTRAKLYELMESYNIEAVNGEIDSVAIYQAIRNANIAESDWDSAYKILTEHFHGDIVAAQKRIGDMKSKYLMRSEGSVKQADDIIAELKAKVAKGEKFTEADIEDLITARPKDNNYDYRDSEKIKAMIMDDPELQAAYD